MRKIIITGLILATALPGVTQAQTRREVAEDARGLRDARRDLRQAERHGDRHDVREARRDVRDARRDYREEVRDYRRANRNVYRQPAWVGPRGYRYSPVGVGGRLAPPLYARGYYVANPGRYRLPPVARTQAWVRHGNDVLLVDTRTGRVLDVNRNFFW